MKLTLDALKEAVEKDAAIRRVQRLQPVGGPGDKIFPPTYPGERGPDHIFETRRIDGKDVRCVLIDSVQSQANRMEEALLEAVHEGRIAIPYVLVVFKGQKLSLKIEGSGKDAKIVWGSGTEYDLSDVGDVTSLDAPHRIFDAIIRDSEGAVSEQEERLKRLTLAKPTNALPVFDVCPSSLLFGVWNSHGEGGGLGAKFSRCIVSEIVAVEARDGKRGSLRIDPLGASKSVGIIKTNLGWRVAQPNEKGAVRPSEIGHSNVPASRSKEDKRNIWESGVTIDYAFHSAVVTCAGLRRLKFPGIKDETAGRAVLASLALVALTGQDRAGYALRSRCDLVCEGMAPFEIVHPDGSTEEFEIYADDAVVIFKQAVTAAKAAGFPWNEEPIRLVPQKRLLKLVALSRAKALAGESEGDDNNG